MEKLKSPVPNKELVRIKSKKITCASVDHKIELVHLKTCFLHMRKQKRRLAAQKLISMTKLIVEVSHHHVNMPMQFTPPGPFYIVKLGLTGVDIIF